MMMNQIVLIIRKCLIYKKDGERMNDKLLTYNEVLKETLAQKNIYF